MPGSDTPPGPPDARRDLSPQQRTLLALRALRGRQADPAAAPGIPRAPREDGRRHFPLSTAQQQLWLVDQLEEEHRAAYNVPLALRLAGRLDREVLERSIAAVVERHEVLRTVFELRDGEPVQVVSPAAEVPLRRVDLGALPEEEREGAALRHAQAEAREPFDLARGPLLRATLLRLGDEDHVVLVTLHHIVSDAASVGILAGELAALYGAFSRGDPSPLPPLPLQYADYAAWERGEEGSRALEEQLAYWKEALAGELPVLDLPRDRAAPEVRTGHAAVESLAVPAPLAGALRELARREEVTPFILLLAAFKALLHRYTGQTELVVATAVANRGREEVAGLIGYFVNTLLLRTPVAGELGFREWLRRVREVVVRGYAHQEVPLERVVRALGIRRDAEGRPPASVMFVHRNAPGEALRLPGLEVRPFAVAAGGEAFDFTFSVAEGPEGLLAQVQYGVDHYDAATIRRMLGHYVVLLEGIAADPGRRLEELPLLGAGERDELAAFNRTAAPYPDAPLHEQVRAQALRTPGAVAVELGEVRITYAELEERAGRLARLLRARGARRGERVGVCLDRSPEMPVAVLAVLEAGAACVPLDPSYPAERLRLMLEDAGVRLVVTSGGLAERLPAAGVDVLCVDRDADAPDALPADVPPVVVGADDLLYVIFTSGSTGRPKGVGVPHRTLANLLAWQHAQPAYATGVRTLQFSTLSFDASFQEILSTWTTGGTLVLLPEEVQKDATRWVPLLREARIERLFCPFVALRQMAELVDDGAPLPSSLREVLPAGEQLQVPPAVVRLFERLPGCRVHNLYGPTETHVVTAHTLEGPPSAWPALPPIGGPVWNTQLHVLDRSLGPVPVGVPGELYIGGHNLARGYLGRPDLTADRFVPDPFSPVPGARLYRSGDLCRRRPDGVLEFLGRADDQVKVRGFRVEPGEVEAVLARHPAVRGAVVTARADAGSGRRLVAHVVAGSPVTVSELRAFMEARVPAYMVPAAWVFLDRFPLLPSGKTDRRSLPDADSLRPELRQAYAPPRTAPERVLADAWARVLGVERVGIHDRFVELGGDSILGIQAVSHAYRAGVRVTVKQLFDLETVAGLAAVATPALPAAPGGAASGGGPAAGALAEVPGVVEAYPLTPMQQGILFHSLLDPGGAAYVEHVHCTWGGPLDPDAFEAAWRRLAARHPALRTGFAWEGLDRPLQVVHADARLPVESHDWRGLSPERQRLELEEHLRAGDRRSFALDRPPLSHLSVFRLRDDSFDFVWSFHDLVLDGWSAEAVLGEFRELYTAGGGAVELPERPPFREYAEWVQARPLGPAREFWSGTLAGFEAPVLLPPGSAPAGEADEYRRAAAGLPAAASAALRSAAQRHGLTVSDLVHGAWAVLLGRHAGEDDVVFGSVVSGRAVELPGAAEMVGVLVNTLPVRARIAAEAPLAAWLAGLQRDLRAAREHEHAPLAEIQRVSGLRAGTPLFGSILDVTNHPDDRGGGWVARRWSMQKTGYPVFVVAHPGAELRLEVTCRAALHDEAQLRRLPGQLAAVLEGMGGLLGRADAGDAPVGGLPWLTAGEREQVLEEWNRTDTPLPGESLAELFAAQAARTPAALALACGDERLSYAELDLRTRRLARALRAEGVGPESLVALLAPRGLPFWVAVLGVLRAGAAYLPLDPAHPPRRHRQVLEQSRAALVLSAGALLPGLAAALEGADAPAARLLPLEELLARPEPPAGGGDADARPWARSLAYVIFTSGSTGAPKGAMVEQRGMLNHLHAKIAALAIGAADRVAQTASQCFDISVWQFLAGLLVGAEVHVIPDEVAHDPAALAREVEARGITILETVPSLMRLLVEEVGAGGAEAPGLGGLRWMIPTGEALPPELARQWLAAYPRVPLLNAYGPTECSDDVTHHVLERGPGAEVRHTPIGRAIGNVRLYVLDGSGDPVPVGVAGELYVGGECVGRGYVRDAARSAEAFVPDAYGGGVGERLYRTGDRVRWLGTGELEYLGRLDEQVKLRGFRIEPGEIEAVLGEHPAVGQAAVVVREEGRGGEYLAAYLAPVAGGELPGAGELRGYLRERLPEYMMPAAFVALEALPLGATGKLDRRALPVPDRAGEEYVPPQTLSQRLLVQVWEEILQLSPVGIRDNFFEAGGHSLLAVRLVARVQALTGTALPVAALFSHPTIEQLAGVLRDRWKHQTQTSGSLVPIQPAGRRRPLFLVHPIGGNVLGYAVLAYHLGMDQPVYGLQSRGLDGAEPPHARVEDMAADYLRSVREVQPDGPYLLAGYSYGGLVALEMARRLEAEGAEALLLLVDAELPGAAGRAEHEPDPLQLLVDFAGTMALPVERLAGFADEFREIDPDERLARVLEVARAADVVPPEIGLAQFRSFFEVYRANRSAASRYEPGACSAAAVLFVTEARPEESRRALVEGWSGRLAGGIEVRTVPGDHVHVLVEPHVRTLAGAIAEVLDGSPPASVDPVR